MNPRRKRLVAKVVPHLNNFLRNAPFGGAREFCELLQLRSAAGAGGVTSLGSRGVTEDVELPKELTPVTSHSIAFVVATLHRSHGGSIR